MVEAQGFLLDIAVEQEYDIVHLLSKVDAKNWATGFRDYLH
ncbi:hypothetical protein GCM10008982_17610 [Anoxybacillus voinovskiensis]|nr:hypothetical protein GCM10008982_17610 [Anoxybacillus voinovskiensis]